MVLVGLCFLTPILTIYQVYHGVSFIGRGNRSAPRAGENNLLYEIEIMIYNCILTTLIIDFTRIVFHWIKPLRESP